MKYKKDEKVRIIDRLHGHNFDIVEIVIITDVNEDTNNYRCNNRFWIEDDEIEFMKICDCGKPLILFLDENGYRRGVTHTPEDEDWHMKYWSTKKVIERQKSN